MVLNVCIIHGRLRSWQEFMLNQGSGHGKSSWDTLTTAKVSLMFVAPPSWIITGLSLQHIALKVKLTKDSQPISISLSVSI